MLSNNVFKNGGGVLRGCFFFVFPRVGPKHADDADGADDAGDAYT